MTRRQTSVLFEQWASMSSEDQARRRESAARDGPITLAMCQRAQRKTKTKYLLKPMEESVKVPWANALEAKYKTIAASSVEGRTAVDLLQTGLAPNTAMSYDSKLTKFLYYCASAGLEALPASPSTVLRYIGHLAGEGMVHVDSVQPYLSCINTAHVAVGLDPPGNGPAIAQARKGWRQRLRHIGPIDDKRVPLPPWVMKRILQLGDKLVSAGDYKHDAAAMGQLRDVAAILTLYMFFGRSDTGYAAKRVDGIPDIKLHGTNLMFYMRKVKGTVAGERKKTLIYPLAGPGKRTLLRVLSAFFDSAPCTEEYLWKLPQDGTWNPKVIDGMLDRLLALLNVSPPEGYTYSSHSIRSGAASAAFAVDVNILRICFCGGWAQSSTAVYQYIDLTWRPSPEAMFFFGHLRHDTNNLSATF